MNLSCKERFMKALYRKDIDRKPVVCCNQTATVEQMDNLGIYWPEAHKNSEKMAALSAAAWEQTGLENTGMPYCQTVEAEILGCNLMWSGIKFESEREEIKEAIPAVHFEGFSSAQQIKVPESILERGRIPAVLRALEISAEKYGNELPILGHVNGPFSLAAQLVAPEKIMRTIMKEPELIKDFAEIAVDFIAEYGNAMYDHGADVVVIEDMVSTCDLLGPRFYKLHSAPYAKKLVSKLKGPNILHICGNADLILDDMIATGTDCISIDSHTDGKLAVEKSRGKVSVAGNVDSILLLRKKPEDIKNETIRSINAGFDLIAPACAISPLTANQNIKAMVEATKQ